MLESVELPFLVIFFFTVLNLQARAKECQKLKEKLEEQEQPHHYARTTQANLSVLSGLSCQTTASCLANSLAACGARDPTSWSARDIEQILWAGNSKYYEMIKRLGMDDGEFLDLEALVMTHAVVLPIGFSRVTVDGWTYCGNVSVPFDDGNHFCDTLETALHGCSKSLVEVSSSSTINGSLLSELSSLRCIMLWTRTLSMNSDSMARELSLKRSARVA